MLEPRSGQGSWVYGFHSPNKGIKVQNFRELPDRVVERLLSTPPAVGSTPTGSFQLRLRFDAPALGSIPGNGNPIQVGTGALPMD